MLANGERQVAPDVSGIRRDHVARYEFVASRLPPGSRVLDIACGVGYGARILAAAGHRVTAVDASAEAIAFARQHYAHPHIEFVAATAESFRIAPDERFDAVVCFETIEHLERPATVMARLSAHAPALFASVPNETVFPHGGRIKFHFRHYTRAQFAALLTETGWSVDEWHGQAGPTSEVETNIEGRTLIAVARSGADVKTEEATETPPIATDTAAVPEHVAIVGLGPSGTQFYELVRGLGGSSAWCDEVWSVNALGDVLRSDRVFHMDDVLVQERRAAARPESNIARMVDWMKRHPGPIYTSVVRPGYPGLVAFPLEDVLNAGLDNAGAPYFNNTVAYAIAYAIYIGVKTISLFGIDFTRPNAHHAEQGRACCEYWLGVAAARGIRITVPDTTTLLDACAPDAERLYGYDGVDVTFRNEDGRLKVSMVEKPLPTAEEVEHRYDHSRHPNRLVQAERGA